MICELKKENGKHFLVINNLQEIDLNNDFKLQSDQKKNLFDINMRIRHTHDNNLCYHG